MTDIEKKLVLGRFENTMQGYAQFDNAKIGAEVASRFRQAIDEGSADVFSKQRQIFQGEFF